MNKFIIASCIIALTFGWTANPLEHCQCDDYHLSAECNNANYFGCQWSTRATCEKVNCTAQTTDDCLNYPAACYLNTTENNGTCLQFSQCSSLTGNNDTVCQAQNTQCVQPSTTETTCTEFKCSLYPSTNCPRGCFPNGSTCSDTINCQDGTPTNCSIELYCTFNTDEQTCRQTLCSDFTEGEEAGCKFVMATGTTVQPCFWNSTACIEAPGTKNLTSTTCFTNTLGAYHWSSSKIRDGSCISCYGMLLQIVFAIILLLA